MEPLTLPELTGISFDIDDDIHLRRVQPEDAQAIRDTVQRNVDHLYLMEWIKPDNSVDMATEFIERSTKAAEAGESLGFGIYRNGHYIGAIGFASFDPAARRTEIGYWIDQNEERKGIITKACRRLIDFAFNELQMNKIDLRCAAENIRSAAVAKRLGFKEEGRIRQAELRQGKLHDFLWFGLLREEWGPISNDAELA
jgi:ribosomal-protein-serine acetyltransferase